MANDRMFLVCEGCGGRFCLLKHFVNPWVPSNEFPRLEEWLKEHASCDPPAYPAYLRLAYESEAKALEEMETVKELNGILHFHLREAYAHIYRGPASSTRAERFKKAEERITKDIQETAKQRAARGIETRVLPMLLRLGKLEMAVRDHLKKGCNSLHQQQLREALED